MKSSHKVERFDYSKYESVEPNEKIFSEYQFWGIHPKDGRLRIDTKRYEKMITKYGHGLPIPEGILKPRDSVYLIPSRQKRYDYGINLFRDTLWDLRRLWKYEIKPILNTIYAPVNAHELIRDPNTSDSDRQTYMHGIAREERYYQVIRSTTCNFIQRICAEVSDSLFHVMTNLGFKGTKFDFESFCKFSDELVKDDNTRIDKLNEYNSYNLLYKINNFLLNNTKEAYKTLVKYYPEHARLAENNFRHYEYESGMFAADWIVFDRDFIDSLFDNLLKFFEDYCKTFLHEDIDNANWDNDDYFIRVFDEVKYYYNMNATIEVYRDDYINF